jgi:hypothetical protein
VRPRKSYVIFDHGKAVHICDGLTEAKLHVEALSVYGGAASYRPCRNRHAAEVFLTWWNYSREQEAREKREAAQSEKRPYHPA